MKVIQYMIKVLAHFLQPYRGKEKVTEEFKKAYKIKNQKLWVWTEKDNYTKLMRNWGHVKTAVARVKKYLKSNSKKWESSHMGNSGWRPEEEFPDSGELSSFYFKMTGPEIKYSAEKRQEALEKGEELRTNYTLKGCGPNVCKDLSFKYIENVRKYFGDKNNSDAGLKFLTSFAAYSSGLDSIDQVVDTLKDVEVPKGLSVKSVGSFDVYVSVEKIDRKKKKATLNFWIYNDMTELSFGRGINIFKETIGEKSKGLIDTSKMEFLMPTQHMWWGWQEEVDWSK